VTPFIKNDEYILLVEDQDGGHYGFDDLRRLRDAGIRTIIRTPFWKDLEPSLGHYQWDALDEQIDMTLEADLKCMFAVYDKAPSYFPDDWYLKFPNGSRYQGSFYENVISPWSVDGWAYHLDFISRFCERYSGEGILDFRATIHGGEVMLPEFEPYRQDGIFWDTIKRMLLSEQQIFYNAHESHELWTCLHHAFDHLSYSGTEQAGALYYALWNRFPLAAHYCISYTQFRNDVVGEAENLADMKEHNLSTFAGSEYAEGLIANTDEAIAQGFRGFATAPLHALSGHRVLEQWMLDAIRESLAKWSSRV
jgi:hypothetical protein